MRRYGRNLRREKTKVSNQPSFLAPLTHNLLLTKGTGVATFTRATVATLTDFEGLLKIVNAGEARFDGARRVENLISSPTYKSNGAFASWIIAGTITSIVDNNVTAPDGTMTASTLTFSGGVGGIYAMTTNVANSSLLNSIWIKADTPGTVILRNPSDGLGSATLNITTTWSRYTGNVYLAPSTGYGIYIAKGTLGKVYICNAMVENVTGQANQNPSEYVSNGVIRRNLATYSEDFTNAVWGKTNATVTANQIIAPDGTLTADKVEATTTGVTNTTRNFTATSSSISYSIYIKRGSSATHMNKFGIYNWATGLDVVFCQLNLDTGVLSYYVGSTGASVEALPNGWYRIKISPTSGISSGNLISIYWGASGGSETAGNYSYMWGGQLEVGSTATTYQKITDASPSDFNFYHSANVDGVKYFDTYKGNTVVANVVTEATGTKIPEADLKGVMIEVGSTNLCTYSEDFTHANWDKGAVATVTTASIVNPAGGGTCSKISATGTGYGYVRQAVFASTVGSFNSSAFVKRGNSRYVSIRGRGVTTPQVDYFDFDTETFVNNTGNTLSFISYPNGWYRIISGRVSGEAVTYFSICPVVTVLGGEFDVFAGQYFYAWGGQGTTQPEATSYIPTTTASVTRNADVLTFPNAGNVSNTQGTVLFSATPLVNIPNNNTAGDGKRWLLDLGNATGLFIENHTLKLFDGTNIVTLAFIPLADITYKVALSYGSAGLKVYLNGVSASGSFDGSMNLGTNLTVGGSSSGTTLNWNGMIKDLVLYRLQLTDYQMIKLTT